MTYQLIDKIGFTSASVSSSVMILVIRRTISIMTSEMVLSFYFLVTCDFPDLPIVFCEYRSHLCLVFHHISMEIYSKSGFVRPLSNGTKFSFLGCLHWQRFWWRHRYDSWFLNNFIEVSIHLLDLGNFSVGSDDPTLLFRSI